MNALILGLLWMVYYALHSAMATRSFKRFLRKRLSNLYPYYRSIYSFFAAVNFFLLFFLHDMAPSDRVYVSNLILRYAGFAILLSGGIVIIIAGKNYGLGFFYRESIEKDLVKTGMNAYVRHPLYFGVLLALIGFFLAFPYWKNLVFLVVTLIYVIIGSLLEEQKLIDDFGDEYREYRKEVKMLIPGLF